LDPSRRATRTLAGATARQQGGALDEALALLAGADAGSLYDHQGAQDALLRARISFATDRGRGAPALLVAAAARFEPLDILLARETYLDALSAAVFAGRLAGRWDGRAVATRALAAPASPAEPRAVDLLLDGVAQLITHGPAVGTPILRDAVGAFRSDDVASAAGLRWLW